MDLLIRDETPGTMPEDAMTLAVDGPAISARDLIRARVELEMEGREHCGARSLFVPDEAEQALNGDRGPYRSAPRDRVEEAVATALAGFDGGKFFLFAGESQVSSLDEQISVLDTTAVTFLKLTPLRGG